MKFELIINGKLENTSRHIKLHTVLLNKPKNRDSDTIIYRARHKPGSNKKPPTYLIM